MLRKVLMVMKAAKLEQGRSRAVGGQEQGQEGQKQGRGQEQGRSRNRAGAGQEQGKGR